MAARELCTGHTHNGEGNDHSPCHDTYVPRALTQELREELSRKNEQALHTPITRMTPKALAMESERLSILAERDCLERLQKELEDRARR